MGCGKALTSKTGTYTIMSGGKNREYIIDIPANYDPNKPYRLFFAFHWIGSTDDAVANGQVTNGGAQNWGYYGLKREATMANDPAIFVAPQSDGSTWGQADHAFFDAMYQKFTDELCVDTSRVFATGFSFGAMMTYSLSLNHQKQLRAVVAIAAANFNIYDPPDTKEPIAYMGTVGMSDGTCPYVQSDANKTGGKYCALTHAQDNGCTIPNDIPTTTKGSKSHVCYDFQGCKAGYPVKMCTFDGTHQAAPADGGTADNGLTSWIPTESWKFFTQF
jgi:poly(3-hydroxybutyrate) depolymerase